MKASPYINMKVGPDLAEWINDQAKFNQIPVGTQARMILAQAMRASEQVEKEASEVNPQPVQKSG